MFFGADVISVPKADVFRDAAAEEEAVVELVIRIGEVGREISFIRSWIRDGSSTETNYRIKKI